MSEGGGGCGCTGIIMFCILIAILWGGITYDGKHYDIDCGCSGFQVIEE